MRRNSVTASLLPAAARPMTHEAAPIPGRRHPANRCRRNARTGLRSLVYDGIRPPCSDMGSSTRHSSTRRTDSPPALPRLAVMA